jgi:ABC-2 type transport system permease protein
MWRRLRALIIKELLAVLRDRRSRFILIGPPLMQIFLFSYAATLDVTNIQMGVLNRDAGRWSAEFLQRIDGAPAFRRIINFTSQQEVAEAINNRRVVAVIEFAHDFSRDISTGRQAKAQLLLDGRRSNAAQIIAGYLTSIASDISRDISISLSAQGAAEPRTMIASRYWFNPNLDDFWYIVPSLMGTLALLLSLVVTGQSVARERELGTFDQLMVSPLRVTEILIGKTLPPLIIGLVQLSAFLCVAVFFFQVPFRGSLLLLYLGAIFFLASTIGVGLFISSLSQTQQQAFLGAFLFTAPAILLSGFATPVENMPGWLQVITMVDPLRHFLVIVRGVFLKGMPALDVAANILPLCLIAIFTLTTAGWLFRSRME